MSSGDSGDENAAGDAPLAAIVTIGDELLLGQIVDTNAAHIAQVLREDGYKLLRSSTVGDDAGRIAAEVKSAAAAADVVVTTGGLGPTVDDPTRGALADAAGVALEERPELWRDITARYRGFGREPTDNNRRQAMVPEGAEAILNPLGTAPAFVVEVDGVPVVALPGVPREMRYLLESEVMPRLRQRFGRRGAMRMRVLHCAGAGESQIDERIGDLQGLPNPVVGLAAHLGEVDVRIVARGANEEDAEALVERTEAEVRRRLGGWVFGADGETLERVVGRALGAAGWRLAAVEMGLGGTLAQRLANMGGPFAVCEVRPARALEETADIEAWLRESAARLRESAGSSVGLAAAVVPGTDRTDGDPRIWVVLEAPGLSRASQLGHAGGDDAAPRRAAIAALNLARKALLPDEPGGTH